MMEQLLNLVVTPAYADTVPVAPASQGGGMSFVLMFIVFFLFIYFGIWRPQNKRAKEQQNLMNALTKGDEVVLAGGMLGRIAKITDAYLTITIAPSVDIAVQKSAVVTVLPKGTLKSIE